MPFLDVSEVLNDPEIADTGLICTRRVQTVSASGLASDAATNFPFTGVVTQAGGDVLERLAGGSHITGSITIHTTFFLRDGAAGGDADLVTWHGRQYTVTDVGDYSNFGAGFVGARCELVPLSGG